VDIGIEGEWIESLGIGEAEPVRSNDTRERRARNRRVELEPIDRPIDPEAFGVDLICSRDSGMPVAARAPRRKEP